ncbi:hypothetical protein ACLQ3B_09285 [Micromonospora sp. DT53]|uniref:hypothetical protein n=1 Tax=Micromonospora sp. DT53 TaxID=3393444 RepID=UPI003CE71660
MSTSPSSVTIRPITGSDEIALFNRLPYTINHELDDDLGPPRRGTRILGEENVPRIRAGYVTFERAINMAW